MKLCIVYFSRTGYTRLMAEAVSKATQAPIFDAAISNPSVVNGYDVVMLGTPVEGFRPARETLAFVKGISRANDKVAILFRTYFLWKGTTFGTLGRQLGSKGYKCILKVSTKKVVSGQTDFSDAVKKVNKTLEHIRFVNWFSSRSIRSKKLGLEYSCFQK